MVQTDNDYDGLKVTYLYTINRKFTKLSIEYSSFNSKCDKYIRQWVASQVIHNV